MWHFWVAFVSATLAVSAPLPTLPQLDIDPDGISISGLLSGADFVVKMKVRRNMPTVQDILDVNGVHTGEIWVHIRTDGVLYGS